MKMFTNGLLANLVAAGAIGAGIYLYRKNKGVNVFGKSAAETAVDELYGPAQRWKTTPVYNTPGRPGYIPTLPASYAPGDNPLLVAATPRPANYIGPPPSLPVGADNNTVDPFMFGLGEWRFMRSGMFRAAITQPRPSFSPQNASASPFRFGWTGFRRQAAAPVSYRGFGFSSRIPGRRYNAKGQELSPNQSDREMGEVGRSGADGLGRMILGRAPVRRRRVAVARNIFRGDNYNTGRYTGSE